MGILHWLVIIGVQGVLCLLLALPLWRYVVSEFTAKQRIHDAGQAQGAKLRWLFRFHPQLVVLRSALVCLLILFTTTLLSVLYTPWKGLLITSIFLCGTLLVSRISLVVQLSENILLKKFSYAQAIIRFTDIFLTPFSRRINSAADIQPDSYEEFLDTVRRLPSVVLAPQQKQRIESILSADTKTVKDIMTLKKRVVTVQPSATLGPILLSDLEKSGHGFFPVATKKGEPEGILQLRDVANIHDAKQKVHVRELMKDHIVWVADGTDLIVLTDLFLKAKQHILFVRNPEGEFSGIVTIADLIKHLVGIVAE